MHGTFRLIYRAVFSIACIFIIIGLMSITWAFQLRRATRAIMQMAFKAGAYVWDIHITVQGSLAPTRPLLIVSNHFTYLDLFVLGSKVPAAFTPKSEIRSWPIVGFMCKVSGCLFIDRRATRTVENKILLEAALKAGDIISLFPEGTTNDGSGLLPFKSSYFSIAEQPGVMVQPISIAYTQLNGKPIDEKNRHIVGWYGDSYFFPHVGYFLRQKNVEATLIFHSPISAASFTSRKELALHCRSVIENPLPKMV